MTRDRRLLIAILLFAGSFIGELVQVMITWLYINSVVLDGGAQFAKLFSVEFPREAALKSGGGCFDFCAPALPFVAGWIAIAAFLVGWVFLAYAWWQPKRQKD